MVEPPITFSGVFMKLVDKGADLKAAQIEEFEELFKISIPEAYKTFLVNENGGRPVPATILLKTDDSERPFDVEEFLRLEPEDETWGLRSVRLTCLDRIPSELLAIARDGGEDFICIGLSGKRVGEIYIWWSEGQCYPDEEPTFENVEKIADSFGEFISYFR